MKYKKEFENQNIYIDKLKCFLIGNDENKEIISKFIPNLFDYDVDNTKTESEPNSTNAKRKTKRSKPTDLAV